MALRVAVQMDPLEKIGIAGDSTFAIMLKGQELGHQLYHYLAEDLTYNEGRLYAGAHEVTVQPVEKSFTDEQIGEISGRIVAAAEKLGTRLRA